MLTSGGGNGAFGGVRGRAGVRRERAGGDAGDDEESNKGLGRPF